MSEFGGLRKTRRDPGSLHFADGGMDVLLYSKWKYWGDDLHVE